MLSTDNSCCSVKIMHSAFALIVLPKQNEQRLRPIDYSALILSGLIQIGLEFEVQEGVVRIWGYAPKSYDDLPPQHMA